MNRSFSKIRHIQMVNENLEKKRQQKLLNENDEISPIFKTIVDCFMTVFKKKGLPALVPPSSCMSTMPDSKCVSDLIDLAIKNTVYTAEMIVCLNDYNQGKPQEQKVEIPPVPNPTNPFGDMINQGVKVGTDIIRNIPGNPF